MLTNVILGTVGSQAVCSDFELLGAVAKGQETENAEQQADGLGRDRLDGSHIDSLRVVTEPVSKVDTGDSELVKLLAAGGTSQEKSEQSILDITVAPCKASVSLAKKGRKNSSIGKGMRLAARIIDSRSITYSSGPRPWK